MRINNFCPNCGSKIVKGAEYCMNCGTKIYNQSVSVQKDNTSDIISELSMDNKTASETSYFNKSRFSRGDYRKYMATVLFLGVSLKKITKLFHHNYPSLAVIIIAIAVVAFLFTFYFISVKRFHDLNKSGWNIFALLIPFYGMYIFHLLLNEKGTVGINNYGNNN